MPFRSKQPVIFKFLHYCMKCHVFFDYLQFSLTSILLLLVFSRRSFFWHIVLICFQMKPLNTVYLNTYTKHLKYDAKILHQFWVILHLIRNILHYFWNILHYLWDILHIHTNERKSKDMQISCIVYSISIILM